MPGIPCISEDTTRAAIVEAFERDAHGMRRADPAWADALGFSLAAAIVIAGHPCP